MKKKAAFVLSGCGFKDGSEIHEAVCAMIALDGSGFEVVCVAPDINQKRTLNHITDESLAEERNVLVESARIARGNIRSVSDLQHKEFDVLVFPGGFGSALNLCTFAIDGTNCTVNPEIHELVTRAHSDRKPIAAMCIAPVLIARCLGNGVRLTIGTDKATASAINSMGGIHVECLVDDAVVDTDKRVVSTPAYMLAKGPAEVYAGATRMIEELEKLLLY